MYDIQWFKVESNIFSNRKIQIILKLPDGDTYFRVWIQLIIELEMILKEGETFLIKNFHIYQSIDKYENVKAQNRERQRKHREKVKNESEKSNVIVTQSNGEEIRKDLENKEENKKGDDSENGFRKYKLQQNY